MIDTQEYTLYQVVKVERSASAIVIFARHPQTGVVGVLKVLREMKDKRYDLSTLEKRQKCQMRASAWNPQFTSGVYLSLAPIRETLTELEQKMFALEEIGVGPAIHNPQQAEPFEKTKEYALLMGRLPENLRLDKLLEADRSYKRDEPIPSYLLLLLKRICAIHEDNTNFPTFGYDKDELEVSEWGSIEQLREKLKGNLAWLEDEVSSKLAWKPGLSDTCIRLKENLPKVLDLKKYQSMFQSRLKEKHIKHCHGDLKADNLWIEVGEFQCEEERELCVRLLDCIDFKLVFCMIDTLSDIALLVADIQARTGNVDLANAIVDEYLRLSREDEETARCLLSYYLVEKALIGMVNSYVDDKNEELGESYRKVAHQRIDELMARIQDKSSERNLP